MGWSDWYGREGVWRRGECGIGVGTRLVCGRCPRVMGGFDGGGRDGCRHGKAVSRWVRDRLGRGVVGLRRKLVR